MLGYRLGTRRLVVVGLLAAGLGAAGVVWSTEEPAPAARAAGLGTVLTATRHGDTVAVDRRDLDTGRTEQLFTYLERRAYPGSDNPAYADLPSSPSLSPDGRRVAYTDFSSVKIRDLASGKTTTVVAGVPQGEEMPLRWSIPQMNCDPETDSVWGIYGVYEPEWSPDGRQLAFHQAWYEGSDFGIVDLSSGQYHSAPGGSELDWVGPGSRLVTAGSFYTEAGRVHVARPDQPGRYTDVTAGAPEERSYDSVAVSPDGDHLAVTWAEQALMTDRCCAALLSVDGTLIRRLPVGGQVQSTAFGTDGSSLYVAERRDGRTRLLRHPVAGGAPTEVAVLPGDLYAWAIDTRADGSLALLGRTRGPWEGDEPGRCEHKCPPYRSRLLVVDTGTGETRYESGDLGRFTSVEGFEHS